MKEASGRLEAKLSLDLGKHTVPDPLEIVALAKMGFQLIKLSQL